MKKPNGMKKLTIILSGALIVVVAVVVLAISLMSGMSKVAKEQLALIRQDKVQEAYDLYSSKDLKSGVSPDAFKKFLTKYPVVQRSVDVTFSSKAVQDDIGYLDGSLIAKDGSVAPISYTLIKEDGSWKIQGINMNNGLGVAFAGMAMSDKADKNGSVALDKGVTVFSSNTAKIFMSVYLQNAKAGTSISAEMIYSKTGEKVGPVANKIDKDGDLVSNFTFSKPTKGWPVGDYSVKISMSSGESKSFAFKVQ